MDYLCLRQRQTLLIAGHETTATALAWAFYWIHRLPEVRQKLMTELEAHRYNPDRMAIARLPYLTAVCNETLRIYPVDAAAMHQTGYRFYCSENGVWLVDTVPPEYLAIAN